MSKNTIIAESLKNQVKTVNLITNENVEKLLFPDNQPHLRVIGIKEGECVRVVCPIRSSLEALHLLQVSNALYHLGAYKTELVIPYLMGARYDRLMKSGDSLDLEVVAGIINSCAFQSVNLFDVHSSVALEMIANSRSHNNSRLVRQYAMSDAVLICPDEGAREKVRQYGEWNPNLKEVVFCKKNRDEFGNVTLAVLMPDKCENRNCVIIDDICDGGATFLAIAKQIRPLHLTLIVSHGIFSKGFGKLRESFDEIITTDSFALHASYKVTTIPLNL